MNTETGTPYSRDQLLDAFNKVCNKHNWKNPINALVEEKDQSVITEAVIFFTGSVPSFTPVKGAVGILRCRARGYYETIGA